MKILSCFRFTTHGSKTIDYQEYYLQLPSKTLWGAMNSFYIFYLLVREKLAI